MSMGVFLTRGRFFNNIAVLSNLEMYGMFLQVEHHGLIFRSDRK